MKPEVDTGGERLPAAAGCESSGADRGFWVPGIGFKGSGVGCETLGFRALISCSGIWSREQFMGLELMVKAFEVLTAKPPPNTTAQTRPY